MRTGCCFSSVNARETVCLGRVGRKRAILAMSISFGGRVCYIPAMADATTHAICDGGVTCEEKESCGLLPDSHIGF
jgi:hypothetical protein